MQSQKYELNADDGVKIVKVFGWLLASTTVSFLITLLPQLNLGDMGWILPIANIALVTIDKFIQDNK